MRIALTGATGFIGHHVVGYLINLEHDIIICSSSIEHAKRLFKSDRIKYIFIDLDNLDESVNYFTRISEPDLLIHMAWQGLPNYNSDFHLYKNLPVHKKFLGNLLKNGLKHLAVTGTCMEYGLAGGKLSESLAPNPQNFYSKAKDELRIYLEGLQKKYHFILQWMRLFYTYGDGQNAKAILSQLRQAIADKSEEFKMSRGDQLRDYLPVELMAEYICKIALQSSVAGVINCCSGTPVAVEDLVNNYLNRINKQIKLNKGFYPYSTDEAKDFWGDNTKLKTIINEND